MTTEQQRHDAASEARISVLHDDAERLIRQAATAQHERRVARCWLALPFAFTAVLVWLITGAFGVSWDEHQACRYMGALACTQTRPDGYFWWHWATSGMFLSIALLIVLSALTIRLTPRTTLPPKGTP